MWTLHSVKIYYLFNFNKNSEKTSFFDVVRPRCRNLRNFDSPHDIFREFNCFTIIHSVGKSTIKRDLSQIFPWNQLLSNPKCGKSGYFMYYHDFCEKKLERFSWNRSKCEIGTLYLVKVELAYFCVVVWRKFFQRDSVLVYFSTLCFSNLSFTEFFRYLNFPWKCISV